MSERSRLSGCDSSCSCANDPATRLTHRHGQLPFSNGFSRHSNSSQTHTRPGYNRTPNSHRMPTDLAQDRLGDLFVREGLVSADQLKEALIEAKQSGTRLGHALVKLGLVDEDELTRMLSKQYRVPAVDLGKVKVDEKVLRLIPDELAFKHLVLPIRRVGRTLTVAMANPTDMGAVDDLKFITRHEIEPLVVGEYTLREHLETYYETADDRMAELLSDFIQEEDMEFVEEDQEEISIAALQEQVDAAPVVKFINGLLTDAVAKGASDIHIEPYEKEVRVRYRVDGTLTDVMSPPHEDAGRPHFAHQDSGGPEYCGAAGPSGRTDQAEDEKAGRRLPGLYPARDFRREDRRKDPGQGESEF